MKQLSILGFFVALASVLAGCPIFDDHGGGNYGQCVADSEGRCVGYGTTTTTVGNAGVPCAGPLGCGTNESCGQDGQCHPGDCTFWGCVAGYECAVDANQSASCVVPGGNGGSSQGGSGQGGSAQGGSAQGGSAQGGSAQGGSAQGGSGQGGALPPPVYCGNPGDCGQGLVCAPDGTCKAGDCTKLGCVYGFQCDGPTKTCGPINPATCGADADCAAHGAGFACVDGLCTSPADQCWDQGQCPAGDKCAAGKCVKKCSADAECGGGFGCEVSLGICSAITQACTLTSDCGSAALVCVGGACVGRSNQGSCADAGAVWVENGCVPGQKATFNCSGDGIKDACAAGSICLHHGCYISCEANAAICANVPGLSLCKSVTTASGVHSVCGSSQNLGSDCDPTANPPKACDQGKVCIDGYCN